MCATRSVARACPRRPEGPGTYQVHRMGEKWPKAWTKTDDVAGSMAAWGLDVKWPYVDEAVQRWVMGRGKKPRLKVLKHHRSYRRKKHASP